jgi:hypothetical protein
LPEELCETLTLIRSLFSIEQICVESNPNHLVPETIRRLKEVGVNRLSVGVQSFDDALLREMRRYTPYGSGQEIVGWLKGAQGVFDTLNVDMIFNFPHQTTASLEEVFNESFWSRVQQIFSSSDQRGSWCLDRITGRAWQRHPFIHGCRTILSPGSLFGSPAHRAIGSIRTAIAGWKHWQFLVWRYYWLRLALSWHCGLLDEK